MDWTTILEIVLQIIGAFAVTAAATPNSHRNKVLDGVLRAVNVAGANVFQARNQ